MISSSEEGGKGIGMHKKFLRIILCITCILSLFPGLAFQYCICNIDLREIHSYFYENEDFSFKFQNDVSNYISNIEFGNICVYTRFNSL